MNSYKTRNRKLKKKIAKTLENTIIASFQDKIGWERLRKRENNINRSAVFLPDP